MTFWSAGGPNLPALQLFLAKEFLLVRKYNTILSILLIAASAVGIHLSLNFDVRGGNVGDPGAAFWPIMLCGGLILCSVILLVQTALEAKKATAPEAPLIDFATAGVHCVLIIFVIMIAYGTTRAKVNTKLERVLPSKSDLVTIFPTLIRSSLIGTLIGAIPGTGGDIASWVGYNEAKRWSKHPEQFGDGAPDGIAAPESANNAISGGALIPLLSLGIPGDACTAIMLGCLMMLGITPGPLLMTEQPAKVYMIIVGLFFANAFMALRGFAGIRIFTKISSVPSIVLTPLIFVFCFVGTFAVNHTVGDIYLMILCGILGFPIYLYAIPQCATNDLKPELVAELLKTCPNIVGIKYSYADMIRLKDYLLLNDGNFSVLFGADRLFLPALVMGCEGTVSGCSGPMPEHFVNVYKAYLAGDMKTALKEQQTANEICEIMKSGADMGIFKAVLQMRGMTGGHMRAPLIDLDEDEKKALHDQIAPYL